jgi:hypothetical protein
MGTKVGTIKLKRFWVILSPAMPASSAFGVEILSQSASICSIRPQPFSFLRISIIYTSTATTKNTRSISLDSHSKLTELLATCRQLFPVQETAPQSPALPPYSPSRNGSPETVSNKRSLRLKQGLRSDDSH